MTYDQAHTIICLLSFAITYRVVRDGIKAFCGDR
jgi:hypothetical protein